jgi:Uma2 family endonuclease
VNILQFDKDKIYTYEDYVSWDDGNRYELIGGVPYAMAAPSRDHQRVSRELIAQFTISLRNRTCEVFHAPFDVCLNALGDKDRTVVQPDLMVVCDKSKIDNNKYCNGAPDLVIEIISPASKKRDWFTKLYLYKKVGVREYWIVDPRYRRIDVFMLDEDWSDTDKLDDVSKTYTEKDEVLSVSFIDKCEIDLKSVFDVLR